MRSHNQFAITRYSPASGNPVGGTGPAEVAKSSGALGGGMLFLACLCLTSGCASGFQATCAPYEEHKRRAIIASNARSETRQAWGEGYADQHTGDSNSADARHGFVTGYVETALGYVSSPPPVPSRPCISIHSLTHTYPDANAWYTGYHQGVASALARGVDQWRLAPLDPGLLYSQCKHEITSHSGGFASELPAGAMIDSEQYPESEQPGDPPADLSPSQDLRSWLQQNSEQIPQPLDAEIL